MSEGRRPPGGVAATPGGDGDSARPAAVEAHDSWSLRRRQPGGGTEEAAASGGGSRPGRPGRWRGRQEGVDLQCTTAVVAAPGHRSGRTYPAVMATGENGSRRGGQPGAGVRVAPCLPRRQPAQVPVGEGGSRQREQPHRPAAEAAGHGCRSGSAGVVREVAGGCSVGSGRSTWPRAASVKWWPRR